MQSSRCITRASLFCFSLALLMLCCGGLFPADGWSATEPAIQIMPAEASGTKFAFEPQTKASGTSSPRWHADIPRPQGKTLDGIWGSSAQDVFAVGADGLIMHYDGTAWKQMTSGTAKWLFGVWGSSAQRVFAVGTYGTILQYNGSTWSQMSCGTTNILRGVWVRMSTLSENTARSFTMTAHPGASWRDGP